MGTVVLPRLSQTGTNEWLDVESNDIALRDEINGNLDNTNLKAAAAIAHSKLANGTAGQFLIADASGVITATSIADGLGVNVGGVTRRGFAQVLTEETTTSTSFADLTTVGPSLTISTFTSSLVLVLAEVTAKNSLGASDEQVGLHEATDFATAAQILDFTVGTAFETRWTQGIGSSLSRATAGFLTFPQTTSGSKTYKLQYKVDGGTGSFKDRKLWVWGIDF